MIAIVAADKEGPQGVAPAQLPPARLVGHQLRGRHHPHPQREVPHRRQGQHRVQPVPGAALPRLGDRLGGEEPRRPGQRGSRVREALRVLLLRPERSDGAGEAHRGTPLQRLGAAPDRAPSPRGSVRVLKRLMARTMPACTARDPFPMSSRSSSRSRADRATSTSTTRKSGSTASTACSVERGLLQLRLRVHRGHARRRRRPHRRAADHRRADVHRLPRLGAADRRPGDARRDGRGLQDAVRGHRRPHQQHIERLDQMRPHRLVEIDHFFQTYKTLEDKDGRRRRLARSRRGAADPARGSSPVVERGRPGGTLRRLDPAPTADRR